jgi:hypothetical protein
MPWPSILIFSIFLYIVCDSLAGTYVAVKYGRDMVGSDLHKALALQWTVRILAVLALVFTIWLGMFATVLFQGQGSVVVQGFAAFFTVLWNLFTLVIVEFFRIVF